MAFDRKLPGEFLCVERQQGWGDEGDSRAGGVRETAGLGGMRETAGLGGGVMRATAGLGVEGAGTARLWGEAGRGG